MVGYKTKKISRLGRQASKTKMKNITIALPNLYVNYLEGLVKVGLFPSRSEALRTAVRKYLKKELIFMEKLKCES